MLSVHRNLYPLRAARVAISLLAVVFAAGCHGSSPTAAATVASIAITGTIPTVVGQGNQLSAVATLSNTTTQDVTTTASWLSSDTTVATISSTGVLTIVTATIASATITATYQGVSGTFAVNTQPVRSITISGPSTLVIPQAVQYTATAHLSDGTSMDVTSLAGWSPLGGTVGEPYFTVSGGLVTALQPLQFGSTSPYPTITAAYQGVLGSTTISVVQPCQLTSVSGSLPGATALSSTFLRISPPASGGTFFVNVGAPPGCAWSTVAVDANGNGVLPSAFATVNSGGDGSGNGVISFTLSSGFTTGTLRIIAAGAGSNATLLLPLGVVEWFTP